MSDERGGSLEDVKEDISAERNEQPMSLKSKIVLSLCLFILLGFFAAIIVSAGQLPPFIETEACKSLS
jgi:ribose/xylose/arabinose/galactoside ABC-type transport system permease subunit